MRVLISLYAAAALWACGTAITPPECRPTIVQPARGSAVTPVGRLAGCPNLVVVEGSSPGVRLYVSRANLVGHSDSEINALPEIQRGL
jgi:hypothetical protein